MKIPNSFKVKIQEYLNERAKNDILFGPMYDKEHKNIDDCCQYIFNEAKKKAGSDNAIVLTDEEVYGMAVHYYEEDKIIVDVNKDITAVLSNSIDVNHKLSENDKVTTNEVFGSKLIIDDDDKGLFD